MPSTRERLEHQALRLFAEHGYDSVTTTEIAEAAAVTQRTFFRHFPTKLDALFGDTPRRTDAFVADLYRQPPDLDPATALITALADSAPTDDENERDLLRARVLRGTPSLADAARSYDALLEGHFVGWLAQRTGHEPTDVRVRAVGAMIVAIRRTIIAEWYLNRPDVTLVELTTSLLSLVEPAIRQLTDPATRSPS